MQHYMLSCAVAALALIPGAAHAQFPDQTAKLLADDGTVNDFFGFRVATSGTTAIVGAYQDTDNGIESGSAYLFDTTTGDQLFKLLPNDGAAFDNFGWSVAISGTTAIVGAYLDDDNGNASGSAYLFDTTTGLQIAKLLPNDGAANFNFGLAVGISGTTAIVAASKDDTNGSNSGSAYLFDTTTGLQIAKLLPNDGAAGDFFGARVAISGTTAIVGVPGDDDNGDFSGSAYLFNATTGAQIAKLLPDDGAAGDQFGLGVAISGTNCVVGARYDNDNGTWSGSAYLFDTTTGIQIAKILPDDGATVDFFGFSVGISGDIVIVSAYLDDDNGSGSGSAYLFDTITGEQIAKLLPDDGAAGHNFGYAVAIGDGIAICGAYLDDDNGLSSGSAYVFDADPDTDGDGLLDSWETLGIPYLDGSGAQQRFILPGADRLFKDLYVEVDAMTGLSFSNAAKDLVVTAFDNAPLTNPIALDGVTLHVLHDETNLPLIAVWQTDGCWPLDFDAKRTASYGTLDERNDPDSVALLEAKAKAYRYCIVADTAAPNNIGGCGQTPGDNFIIFIGGGAYNDKNQAAVFMHELGHNLSLNHGGGDGINGKPNYPSIMNYVQSYEYAWNKDFWKLDFSRADAGALGSLNESSLDEAVGIGTSSGLYSSYKMPFGVSELDANSVMVRSVKYVTLNGSKTDFGDTFGLMYQDGDYTTGVAQDLNYAVNPPATIALPTTSSPGEPFTPYDDWANVGLPLAAALGTAAAPVSYPTGELTTEARDWIDVNFPMPPVLCPADLVVDSFVNVTDLLALLGAWGPNPGHVADINGDANVNVTDLLALLAAWGVCP